MPRRVTAISRLSIVNWLFVTLCVEVMAGKAGVINSYVVLRVSMCGRSSCRTMLHSEPRGLSGCRPRCPRTCDLPIRQLHRLLQDVHRRAQWYTLHVCCVICAESASVSVCVPYRISKRTSRESAPLHLGWRLRDCRAIREGISRIEEKVVRCATERLLKNTVFFTFKTFCRLSGRENHKRVTECVPHIHTGQQQERRASIRIQIDISRSTHQKLQHKGNHQATIDVRTHSSLSINREARARQDTHFGPIVIIAMCTCAALPMLCDQK